MERRKFLGLGLTAAAVLPVALSAKDFRKEKPDAWTALTGAKESAPGKIDSAVKALYGDIKTVEEGVKVQAPKVASNGGAVPVKIQSDIPAKSVALFQDVNPEATVAVWDLSEGGMIDYSVKIKMKGSGTITAIVEGKDGKFYLGKVSLEVALGGCEG
ncbi:MAG: thiosulfate oxidation carrier protein SoxY [Sulfurovum sp.]